MTRRMESAGNGCHQSVCVGYTGADVSVAQPRISPIPVAVGFGNKPCMHDSGTESSPSRGPWRIYIATAVVIILYQSFCERRHPSNFQKGPANAPILVHNTSFLLTRFPRMDSEVLWIGFALHRTASQPASRMHRVNQC